jgi:hypothetical protein
MWICAGFRDWAWQVRKIGLSSMGRQTPYFNALGEVNDFLSLIAYYGASETTSPPSILVQPVEA